MQSISHNAHKVYEYVRDFFNIAANAANPRVLSFCRYASQSVIKSKLGRRFLWDRGPTLPTWRHYYECNSNIWAFWGV